MGEVILKIENLSKQYRLGTIGTGTISHDFNRWWAKFRGKEDPYLKIGESNDRTSKGNSEYVWALKDINFEVNRGEVLGIIGKNGAGKSTLLKILSKVTGPSTGSIKSRGRIASLLEVGTGFHPEMTGKENVFLNGAILGMTKKEIASKLDEIVEFSGCERYIDTPVKRYSSGMKVRLAFAVAAFLEPDILVVDEVLAVGDAEFQKKAIGKMQDISKGEGRTVLFVSHNMAAVQNLCTRCLVLKEGGVHGVGSVNQMIDKYIDEDLKFDVATTFDEKKFKSQYHSLIKSVNVFDVLTGKVKHVFKMKEPIGISVKCLIDDADSLDNLGLNVRMDDKESVQIVGWRTKEFDIDFPKKNEISIKLIIKDLNVFDGNYNFTIALVNGAETIDCLDNILKIDIIPGRVDIFKKTVNKTRNLIYSPCEWEFL